MVWQKTIKINNNEYTKQGIQIVNTEMQGKQMEKCLNYFIYRDLHNIQIVQNKIRLKVGKSREYYRDWLSGAAARTGKFKVIVIYKLYKKGSRWCCLKQYK